MNILSIDSSTKNASVALEYNNKIISKNVLNEITHSEKILKIIDEVLDESNLTISDIQMLLCTTGPGSFTGLRIGVSTIKAIAHALNLKIMGMPTLELIAYTSFLKTKKEGYYMPILNARNDRVYYSLYKLENTNESSSNKFKITKLYDISNDNITDALKNINDKYSNMEIKVIGDCALNFKNKIQCYSNMKCDNTDMVIDSKYAIHFYNNILDKSDYIYNYSDFNVLYARPSQAERMRLHE